MAANLKFPPLDVIEAIEMNTDGTIAALILTGFQPRRIPWPSASADEPTVKDLNGVTLGPNDVLQGNTASTGTPGGAGAVVAFFQLNSLGQAVGPIIPRTGSKATFLATPGTLGEIGSITDAGSNALYIFSGVAGTGNIVWPAPLRRQASSGSTPATVMVDNAGATPTTPLDGSLDLQTHRQTGDSGTLASYSIRVGADNYFQGTATTGGPGTAFGSSSYMAYGVSNQVTYVPGGSASTACLGGNLLVGYLNTDTLSAAAVAGTATAFVGGNFMFGSGNTVIGGFNSCLFGLSNMGIYAGTAVTSGSVFFPSYFLFGSSNSFTNNAVSTSPAQAALGNPIGIGFGSGNTFTGPVDVNNMLGVNNTATSAAGNLTENVMQVGHGVSVAKLADTVRIGMGLWHGANSTIAGIDMTGTSATGGVITLGINSAAAANGVLVGAQNGSVESGRSAASHVQVGGSFGLRAKQIFSASGTASVTVQPNVARLRITGTGATSCAITLPASPVEGQILSINNAASGSLTTVTFAGGTVTNSATVAALIAPVNGRAILSYDSTASAWDQIA